MSPGYLTHVTLTTGHSRISPRSEVRDDVVATMDPVVRQALRGEHAPLPIPGYTLTGAVHGQCAIITLWAQHTEGGRPEPVPVLTTGIAPHSRCGAHLWRSLHDRDDLELATVPEEPPPAPCVADRIDVGMAVYSEAAEWTGDLSRVLAWTWIEVRERGADPG